MCCFALSFLEAPAFMMSEGMLNRCRQTTSGCLVHFLCTLNAVRGLCSAPTESPQLPSHLDGSDGQLVGGGRTWSVVSRCVFLSHARTHTHVDLLLGETALNFYPIIKHI